MIRLRAFLADLALIPAAWTSLFHLTRHNLTVRTVPPGAPGRERWEADLARLEEENARWGAWQRRQAGEDDQRPSSWR